MADKKQGAKNLNLTNLKKEVKKLQSQTEHTLFINGSEYKIKIDDKFVKTKQHKLLDDFVAFLNESNNEIKLLDVASSYVTLLFIKHFTNVDIPDDIDEALDVLEAMIDLDILTKIIDLFPEKEVIEMYELLNVNIGRMAQNMEDTSEEAMRLAQLVKNEELKEALLNGREE